MLVCGLIVPEFDIPKEVPIVGLPRVVVPKVGAASAGDPSVPVVAPSVPVPPSSEFVPRVPVPAVATPNGVVPDSVPEDDSAVGAGMKAGTVGAVEPVAAAGVLDVLDPALGVPINEPTLAALLVPMTAPAGPLEGLFAPGSVVVVPAGAVAAAGAGPGY